jgi:hypothetical protein
VRLLAQNEIMRWMLSIFRLRKEPPRLREWPVLLAKCIVFGAVTGLSRERARQLREAMGVE